MLVMYMYMLNAQNNDNNYIKDNYGTEQYRYLQV